MGKKDASTVGLDDDVIRLTVVGNVNGEMGKYLLHEVEQLCREVRARKQKVLLLIDVTAGGTTDTTARGLAQQFFKSVRYNRIAFYGASKKNTEVLRYLIGAIGGILRIKSFKTEAQALRWLRRESIPPTIKARRLLFLAAGITLLAALWQQFVAPYLLRLPNDFSYQASVISYDNFYNDQTASYSGKTLSNTKFSYQALAAHGDVLDIRNSFDVRTTTGEKIFAVERTYGIDQRTGQHVPSQGDERRSGYLFAPRNLAKQDFTYWHINHDTPALMRFEDEEGVLGLKTFRYSADYHADQTKNLTNLPGVGVTRGINLDISLKLWIEPTTGYLVKYTDDTVAYYYDLKTGKRLNPWNHFSNNYSYDSTANHVQLATKEKQRQETIQIGVPITLAIVVLAILLYAGVLAEREKSGEVKLLVWSRVGLATVGGVAIAVIFGWATKNTLLTQLHPSFSAMHILSAASFLLITITVWLLLKRPLDQARRWVALGLLAMVAISQCLYLIHYLFGLPLAIDALLRQLDLTPISAISPVTELCFLLIATALGVSLSTGSRFARFAAQSLLLMTLLMALFSISGYAFNLQSLYAIAWFRAMALHTAILFVILVVVIFMTHPEWSFTKSIRSVSKSVLLSLAVLALLLLATGLAWQQALSSVASRAELRFEADASELSTKTTSELGGFLKALQGAKGLLAASQEVNRSEWKAYVDGLHLAQNYPGMLGLGFAQVVSPSQKTTHIDTIRRQGFPNYTIRPEGTRDSYSPVVYIEPFDERNQRAFGYDMFSEPVRRQAMERARDSGEASLSGKVTLAQENSTNPQAGLLMYLPIYRNNASITSVEQRRAAVIGYVYAPIRMDDFMHAAIGNQTFGLNVGIFDTSHPEDISLANRLHVLSKDYGIENKHYVPRFVRTETVTIASHDLTLRFSSLPNYNGGTTEGLPFLVLFGGVTLSILLATLTFLLSTSRSRALALANGMTIDLRNERNQAITNQHKDQAILTSIGDGVFVVNMAKEIVMFNKAAELISGFSADQAVGQPYDDILNFYAEKDGRRVDAFVLSALRGKQAEMSHHTLLKRKDGSSIPVADSAAPVVNARGGIDGAVVVFRDISRERQLEKMKDEFLSIASHELRTPMGAIRANAAMMLEGDYGPVNKELITPLTDIHASTIRLVELVNDLLNAARVEAGRMKFSLTDFEITAPLRQIAINLRPLAAEKGIKLVLDTKATAQVQGDQAKLGQVVTNLIGNALKFTDKGSITVVTSRQDAMLKVSIEDTGIGIARAEQSKLFGKFSQIGSQESGKPAGTGLGLYISQQIIRKMGGELWLEASEPGKGSTFAFTIPYSDTTAAYRAKHALEREAHMHPDQK